MDYKIAIALAMSSNHNAVLSALSAHLLGVHATVGQLTGGFNRLKTAIGGALAVTAGVTILETMVKLVEKTKEYSDELVKLETLGGKMATAVQSGDMTKLAFDMSQRVHMKVTDLLKITGTSYSILGQEDTLKVWEPLAKFQRTLQFDKNFKGDAGEEMQKFLRAGELGGRLTDPTTHQAGVEELQRFLDLSSKVMTATHGMVTPSTMLGMSQQAGFSMRGMTDEGFMNMAIAAQAMGGPRAGTALLSTYNQVATGRMTKPAAQGLQDLGLLNEGEITSDHGRVLIATAAKQRLEKLLGSNPMDFVGQIYENLEKQGITDPAEQKRRVANAMSRQTTERFVIEQMMNRGQIDAERERMAGAYGAGQKYDLMDEKSVSANLDALKSAWDNLLVAVAGPNSSTAIGLMKSLTSAIDSVTATINKMDPKTLQEVAVGLGAVAAILTAAGFAAMLTALGSVGAIVAGATAVASAMYILGKIDWAAAAAPGSWLKSTSISDAIATWWDGQTSPGSWLKSNTVADALSAWWNLQMEPVAKWMADTTLSNALTSALTSISNAISNFIESLVLKAKKFLDFGAGPNADPNAPLPKGAKNPFDKFQPTNYQNENGPGSLSEAIKKISFNPGQQQKSQPLTLSLNIDGRTLAQTVSYLQSDLHEFPTGAAAANGLTAWNDGQHNIAST